MNEPNNLEIFVSREGTQYKWDKSQEKVVNLTEEELRLLKFKTTLMTDDDILNTQSGNGIAMGIPVMLNRDRLTELSKKVISVVESQPSIIFSDHVVERLVLEFTEGYTSRGWQSEDDVKHCVLTAKRVYGIRLTVNHKHPLNTDNIKHLHPHIALIIQGRKEDDENGKLVLVIFDEKQIRVVTIL